ncbi:MAG: GIY-YIG nuclease family protein [Candidatus Pacebacteria bacterium]|nr:GIY-YIG nuclease family protein [Candidatus Paceibacterota bacterium]
MNHAYYKKIDRSLLEGWVIIPKEYESDFLHGSEIKPSTSRDIKIKYKNKSFKAKLYHVNRKNSNNVYQLRWDGDKALLSAIRKDFINSYVILKSQKELHENTSGGLKKFRGHMDAGNQEVLTLKSVSVNEILIEPFIQITTEWNTLFERLADANVFGWIFEKDKKYLISRSTGWYSYKELSKHSEQVSVIYYLVNTTKKLLYIGKAENFGNRVKHGRDHQGMSGDWDMFRYDIIRPEFSNILERIEDHTIRSFASVLKNTQSFPSLDISSYKLVNKNWKRL